LTRGIIAAGIVIALSAAPAPPPAVTLPSHNGTLRIAVVGDVGYGTDRVAAGIAKIGAIDAIIIPGDNVYPCGVRAKDDPHWRVLDPLTRFNVPIFPVLGNHDYCGNAAAEINAPLPNWTFPAKQYAIHSDAADFAMIDTMPYVKGGKEPAIAFGASKKWRIVVGHHPIVSSGYHGYFPRSDVRRMRRLLPKLRAEKVDLYICGHDHHQELVEGHPRFLISGAGSEPVPIFILRGASIFPTNVPFREPIGFTLLEITRDTLSITFYDEHARKRGGPMITER
jgi:tartrate-resistant acid phosphatase type 5